MQQQSLIPRWIYIFNHWLWVASLGVFALASVFVVICLLIDWIGGEVLSYEFLCFLEKFYGWCAPSCLAFFSLGTGICTQYIGEHIGDKKEK